MVDEKDIILEKKEQLKRQLEELEQREQELNRKENRSIDFLGEIRQRIINPIEVFLGTKQPSDIEQPRPFDLDKAVKESFENRNDSSLDKPLGQDKKDKKQLTQKQIQSSSFASKVEREESYYENKNKKTKQPGSDIFSGISSIINRLSKDNERERIQKEKEDKFKEKELIKFQREQTRLQKSLNKEKEKQSLQQQRARTKELKQEQRLKDDKYYQLGQEVKRLSDTEKQQSIDSKREVNKMIEDTQREKREEERIKQQILDKNRTTVFTDYELDRAAHSIREVKEKQQAIEKQTPFWEKVKNRVVNTFARKEKLDIPPQDKLTLEEGEKAQIGPLTIIKEKQPSNKLGEQQYTERKVKTEYGGFDVGKDSGKESREDIDYEYQLEQEYKEKYGSNYKEKLEAEKRRRETEFEYKVVRNAPFRFLSEEEQENELQQLVQEVDDKDVRFLHRQREEVETYRNKKGSRKLKEHFQEVRQDVLTGGGDGERKIYGATIYFKEIDSEGNKVGELVPRFSKVSNEYGQMYNNIVSTATRVNEDYKGGSDVTFNTDNRWVVDSVIIHSRTRNPSAKYKFEQMTPEVEYTASLIKLVNIQSGLTLKNEDIERKRMNDEKISSVNANVTSDGPPEVIE